MVDSGGIGVSVSGMKNLINGLLKIFKKPTSTPIESISPPNPTPTLYCLFNRNDPTPTARALHNLNWHNAKILIVGHSNFQRKHKENIERLEVWATGVPKPKKWPDRLWRKDWNWTPLQYENIDFIKIDEITSEALDGIRDGDIVDLTGGTKAQCGELVQAIHQKKSHVTLVLQTQSCQTLNLSTGELRENTQEPSLRERVWLSSGYIVNLSESTRGSAESGLIWSRSPTIIDGKAIVPEDPLELSRALNLDYGMNTKGGEWLEQASAHLISTWPNISESHSGPRMIKPSFGNAAGAAWHVISQPHAKRKKEMFEEILEKTEEMSYQEKMKAWHEYLSSENLTDEIIQCVNNEMHSVECDLLAFDRKTGSVYIGECKRTKITDRDRDRIFSIQKKLFPTNGVPLMVHARDESYSLDDIPIISWPGLSDPEVILRAKMNPKEVKKNPETVAKRKRKRKSKSSSLPDYSPEQIEIIKRTLFLLKEDPREFNPGFIDALRSQDFGETRGILAWIEKNLQKEMGFTIDKDPLQKLSSEEWLTWDLVD